EFFHVWLHPCHQCRIDDSSNGQKSDQREKLMGGIRKKGHRKSQEAVCPHFKKDGGKQDTARGGSLDMSVRKPGVQRKNRYLDGECDGKGGAQPELGRY